MQDIVNREGRCLIPVFALGRAQELLLILGEQGEDSQRYTTYLIIQVRQLVVPDG